MVRIRGKIYLNRDMKAPYDPYVGIGHMYGKEEHQVLTNLQDMRHKTQTIKKFEMFL